MEENKEISPYEYFQNLKEKVNEMNDEKLTELYGKTYHLIKKYEKTGQKKAIKKLFYYLKNIIKEKKIINLGIKKYVYRDDIEEYIENVASNQVVIKDLASYEREIPDEIANVIEQTREYFDEFYVVYTDYTGKEAKKVAKERREKDPILFGVFMDREQGVQNERFYYIGDWVDEYCDLTLDKMVAEMKINQNKKIVHNIYIPNNEDELIESLSNLQIVEENGEKVAKEIKKAKRLGNKKSLFSKIKSAINRRKND